MCHCNVFSFYSLRPHSFVVESFDFAHNSHSHTTPSPCTAPGHPPDRHEVVKEPIEVHTLSQIKKEIEDNLRRPSEKSVPPPIALSLPLRQVVVIYVEKNFYSVAIQSTPVGTDGHGKRPSSNRVAGLVVAGVHI